MKDEIKLKNVCRVCKQKHPPMNIFHLKYNELNMIMDSSVRRAFKHIFSEDIRKKKHIELCVVCYPVVTTTKKDLFETNMAIKVICR